MNYGMTSDTCHGETCLCEQESRKPSQTLTSSCQNMHELAIQNLLELEGFLLTRTCSGQTSHGLFWVCTSYIFA